MCQQAGRGRWLAALLAAQTAATAVTTPAGCVKSLAAYPCLSFFFNRLADVWDAWLGVAVGAALGGGLRDGCVGGHGGCACPVEASADGTPAAAALRGGPAGAADDAGLPAAVPGAACDLHACTAVTTMLYLAVSALVWAVAAPRARDRRARDGWRAARWVESATTATLVLVALAVGAWAALAGVLSRPVGCAGAAARAGEALLVS